jgi:phage baseplate assembly protein W
MYGFAPKLPLATSQTDGAYELLKDYTKLVRQNLKMLILTSPGERVMNPEFGVGIKRYLFEYKSEFIKQEIANRIIDQSNKYIPTAVIQSITYPENSSFGEEFNESRLNISIVFYSTVSNESAVLNLSI